MARHHTIIPLAATALALLASPALAAEDPSQASDDSSGEPSGQATKADPLLAPISACPAQSDVRASRRRQVRAMVCLHRYARRRAGIKRAYTVRRLRKSARAKARDLRRCQQFSHSACGRDAFYWFRRVGFTSGTWGAGENLALGTGELGSARANMAAWLGSPTHRKVLLSRGFRQVGIGLVRGRYEGRGGAQFWVAHFGYRN